MNKRVYLAFFLIALLSPTLFAGWSQMQRLTYRGNEMIPQVVARHDTVHIVWNQSGNAISYIRSTDNGDTWGEIVNLTESGHNGVYASMVITDSVIWVSWMDNNHESIAIISSTNGDSWSNPIYKYTVDSQRFTFPYMAANGDTLFVVYKASLFDSTGLAPYKFLYSSDGGHTWSNLVTIGHVPQNATVQWQVMSYCGGNLLFTCAVDIDSLGGGPHIIGYISYDKGTQWSEPMFISPSHIYWAFSPCVSCNQTTGQFAVGYTDYRYQQYAFYGDIFIKTSDVNPTFWPFETRATTEPTAAWPTVYYDGHCLVTAWYDRRFHDEGADEIMFNRSNDDGLTWKGEQRLTNTNSWSYSPWIYSSNRIIHIVWYEDDTTGNNSSDIYYIKYTPDTSDIVIDETIKPSTFALSAYPNPFNSTLSIDIHSEESGELYISDILGRFVTELKYLKGISIVKWNATDKNGRTVPSGAYFIKKEGGGRKNVLKVMYLK